MKHIIAITVFSMLFATPLECMYNMCDHQKQTTLYTVHKKHDFLTYLMNDNFNNVSMGDHQAIGEFREFIKKTVHIQQSEIPLTQQCSECKTRDHNEIYRTFLACQRAYTNSSSIIDTLIDRSIKGKNSFDDTYRKITTHLSNLPSYSQKLYSIHQLQKRIPKLKHDFENGRELPVPLSTLESLLLCCGICCVTPILPGIMLVINGLIGLLITAITLVVMTILNQSPNGKSVSTALFVCEGALCMVFLVVLCGLSGFCAFASLGIYRERRIRLEPAVILHPRLKKRLDFYERLVEKLIQELRDIKIELHEFDDFKKIARKQYCDLNFSFR